MQKVLLPCVGGKKNKDGKYFPDKNHLHYFQVQTGIWQFQV